MLYPLSILSFLLLALIHLTQGHNQRHSHRVQSSQQALAPDTIPYDIRVYWMRRANTALAELASPCPFGAFGSVVVNHTDTSSDPKGKLVCMSVNQNMQKGNPTLHGNSYNPTEVVVRRSLTKVGNCRRDFCNKQLFGNSYGPRW
jgi:hypothetical protein